jgi:hypothetical protein
VKMVIYKCRELGNPVTETLAAYVAQTTLNKSKSSKDFLRFLISRTMMHFDDRVITSVIGTGRFYLES